MTTRMARAITWGAALAATAAAAWAGGDATLARAAALRTVDVGAFTRDLPAGWRVIRSGGPDGGRRGTLQGDGLVLDFDFSPQGWSRGLPQDTRAYLDDPNALWVPACPFCDAQGRPARDYAASFAPILDRAAHPRGDYLATLTRPDGQQQEVEVQLPDDVKYTRVAWHDEGAVRIGRAESRRPDRGVNGIYLKDRASGATLVVRTDSPVPDGQRPVLAGILGSVHVKGW